ncbi:imidazole glycerol phosphate synthase subunit HisH [Albibacterium profundi]|uniref:Imidazole glycerol phosphate synthase subunit HisH n=1 Tax=Albibacterium profundi TaxID=3134906 RepID=A0ABV5CGW3_9SPHI
MVQEKNKTVGIVNYGAGNIFSLTAALRRQDISYGMINAPGDLKGFERVIIPGVGHAAKAMKKLDTIKMIEAVKALEKPVLGICLGMQLLTRFSEEGDTPLLDLIPLNTTAFSDDVGLKVPHMGWNMVHKEQSSPILTNIDDNSYFYFVHSFYIEYNPKFTVASCNYGLNFSAIIKNKNFYGVQFHPEKSGTAGETLLKNFATL